MVGLVESYSDLKSLVLISPEEFLRGTVSAVETVARLYPSSKSALSPEPAPAPLMPIVGRVIAPLGSSVPVIVRAPHVPPAQ